MSGTTTNYDWDVTSSLPVVLQDGTNSYVYGLGLVSWTDAEGAQTYVLNDGLGSITGLTDGSGNNPVSYSYDVFGAIRTQTGGSANQWLFTGEQRDSESSLYYLRARYYDPNIGRLLTRDPLSGDAGDPQSQNSYAYAQNSPTNLVDPAGLSPSNGEGGQSGWYHGKRFGWWFLGIAPPTCALGDAACWFDYANDVLWPAFHKWLDAMKDLVSDVLKDPGHAIADVATWAYDHPECVGFGVGLTALSIGGPTGVLIGTTWSTYRIVSDIRAGNNQHATIRLSREAVKHSTNLAEQRAGNTVLPYITGFKGSLGWTGVALGGLQCYGSR